MAKATDDQIQRYVNERVRKRSEQIRALLLAMEDDKSAIADVYEALTDAPTWTDSRQDGPPHILTKDDVLAWNAFITDIISNMRNNAQLPIIFKSCVRALHD